MEYLPLESRQEAIGYTGFNCVALCPRGKTETIAAMLNSPNVQTVLDEFPGAEAKTESTTRGPVSVITLPCPIEIAIQKIVAITL